MGKTINENISKKTQPTKKKNNVRLFFCFCVLIIFWSVAISGLLYNELQRVDKLIKDFAINKTRSLLDKDMSYYQWVANQSDLYFVKTEENDNQAKTKESDSSNQRVELMPFTAEALLGLSQRGWAKRTGSSIAIYTNFNQAKNANELEALKSIFDRKASIAVGSAKTDNGKSVTNIMLPIEYDSNPEENIGAKVVKVISLRYPSQEFNHILNQTKTDLVTIFMTTYFVGLIIFLFVLMTLYMLLKKRSQSEVSQIVLKDNDFNLSLADFTAEEMTTLIEQLQQFIDNLAIAAYIKDNSNKFIAVNQLFVDKLGCDKKDIIATDGNQYLTGNASNYFRQFQQIILNATGNQHNENIGLYLGIIFPTVGGYSETEGMSILITENEASLSNDEINSAKKSMDPTTIIANDINTSASTNADLSKQTAPSTSDHNSNNLSEKDGIDNNELAINNRADNNNRSSLDKTKAELLNAKPPHLRYDWQPNQSNQETYIDNEVNYQTPISSQLMADDAEANENDRLQSSLLITGQHSPLNDYSMAEVRKNNQEAATAFSSSSSYRDNTSELNNRENQFINSSQPRIDNNENLFVSESQAHVGSNENLFVSGSQPRVDNNENQFVSGSQPRVDNNKNLFVNDTQPRIDSNENLFVSGSQPRVDNNENLFVNDTQPRIDNNKNLFVSDSQPRVDNNENQFVSGSQPRVDNNKNLFVNDTQPRADNNKNLFVSDSQPRVDNNENLFVSGSQPRIDSNENLFVSGSQPRADNNENLFVSGSQSRIDNNENLFVSDSQPRVDNNENLFVSNTQSRVDNNENLFVSDSQSRIDSNENLFVSGSQPRVDNNENLFVSNTQSRVDNNENLFVSDSQSRVDNNENLFVSDSQPRVDSNENLFVSGSQPRVDNNENLFVSNTQSRVDNNENLFVSDSQSRVDNNENLFVSDSQPRVDSNENLFVNDTQPRIDNNENLFVSDSQSRIDSNENLFVSGSQPRVDSNENLFVSGSQPRADNNENLFVSNTQSRVDNNENLVVSDSQSHVDNNENLLVSGKQAQTSSSSQSKVNRALAENPLVWNNEMRLNNESSEQFIENGVINTNNPKPNISINALGMLNIMVVNDNATEIAHLLSELRQLGHQVHYIDNATDGIAYLFNHPVDLILMDIQMPVMNGIQATATIRKYQRQGKMASVPIIATTTHESGNDKEKYQTCGMDNYLLVSASSHEVSMMITQLVHKLTVN